MVKEYGMFFEQFVKEYIEFVRGFTLSTTNLNFKITSEDYLEVLGEEKQSRLSDIDVVGVKNKEMMIVSCQEYISSMKEMDRIEIQLKFMKKEIKKQFKDFNHSFVVACFGKLKTVQPKDKNLKIWFFRDMFEDMLKTRRKKKTTDATVNGHFEWLVRDLDMSGLLSNREESHKIYKYPPKNWVVSKKEL